MTSLTKSLCVLAAFRPYLTNCTGTSTERFTLLSHCSLGIPLRDRHDMTMLSKSRHEFLSQLISLCHMRTSAAAGGAQISPTRDKTNQICYSSHCQRAFVAAGFNN